MAKNIAIIEFGSNAIRMAEFAIEGKTFKELSLNRIPERLIANLGQKQKVSAGTAAKVINIINDFKNKIGNAEIFAIATAALRNADNKNEFIEQVLKETNIKIDVISSSEEAYFDFLAVQYKLGLTDLLIADVGGGSTELIGVKNNKVINSVSIPIGGVNITNRFFTQLPIKNDEQQLAQKEVQKKLQTLPWLKNFKQPLILLGGASIVLFKLINERKFVKANKLTNKIDGLRQLNSDQLNQLDIPAGTADVINGGVTIIDELIDYSKPSEIATIKASVREGYLIDRIIKPAE